MDELLPNPNGKQWT